MTNHDNTVTTRSRRVTWDDPMVSADAVKTMSGLEFLQAIASGALPAPPISASLAYKLAEVSEGQAIFTIDPAEFHYNPIGMVHGGVAATLLDSAAACAIQSTLPAGTGYTTVELHINYIRPITAVTGSLRCIGQTIHVGRRMATAEARLIDGDGKLYAHATTTCMIFPF
jgi:uncharacterized protein (TIGR00369 family)